MDDVTKLKKITNSFTSSFEKKKKTFIIFPTHFSV